MKNKLLILITALVLSACASTAEPTIITEVQYVTKTASFEQKTLPQRVIPSSIKTDDELAAFLLDTEIHIKLITKKFYDLVDFYEGDVESATE